MNVTHAQRYFDLAAGQKEVKFYDMLSYAFSLRPSALRPRFSAPTHAETKI